jgi:pimeloyl-ACP methyl ester carboxylesterase
MSFDLVVGALFLAFFLTFWYLQIFTRVFSTRYYVQVGLLLAISLSSAYLAIRLFAYRQTWLSLLGIVGIGSIFIYHTGLFIAKFVVETDTRYRRMHKANRAIVNYSSPHQRLTIRTDDGEQLQVIALCNTTQGKSDKAVVICHGAGRNKNTMPIVQTAQILATKYDVYTFDFRGHMESSGVFKADGDTDLDLKAMIDYLKKAGYQKVAVIGWSIGAWTALLSAARGRPIDAIIAAAPPPESMTALFYIKSLQRFKLIQGPILASAAVMRNLWAAEGTHTLNTPEFVRDMPKIPILLIYNEYDYTLKTTADVFEQLHQNMPASSEKYLLPGRGHIFDWPNTFFVWNKMIAWLDENF